LFSISGKCLRERSIDDGVPRRGTAALCAEAFLGAAGLAARGLGREAADVFRLAAARLPFGARFGAAFRADGRAFAAFFLARGRALAELLADRFAAPRRALCFLAISV
jgi:hypothetical protein